MNLKEVMVAYAVLYPYLDDPADDDTVFSYGRNIYNKTKDTPALFAEIVVALTGVSVSKLAEMSGEQAWLLFLDALEATNILRLRAFVEETLHARSE